MLETDRLIIKKSSTLDVDLMLKMDKQEETQKYLGGIKNKSREERIELLKNMDSFTVYLKDNTPIGFIGFKHDNELSYLFDYDYTNKGYCTESCKKLIDESDLKIIISDCVKDNKKSKRVLEKLGFKKIDERQNMIYYELRK